MKHKRPIPQRPMQVLFLSLLVLTGTLTGAAAQEPNKAGLVVQFGDGSYITRCVEFSEPQISGYDVLLRAGLDVEAAVGGGPGVLICGLEGAGCPVSDCMCDYPPNYWSYWHLVGGEWLYSQMGASGYMVRPGDVEGWSWGEGHPPAAVSLEQICAPPATDTPVPTPTWTPTANSSPTPTATWTPLPPTPTETLTPLPTWTPTPTDMPTAIPATATAVPSDTPWPTAVATPAPSVTNAPTATATEASTATPTPVPTTPPPLSPTTAPPTAAETDAASSAGSAPTESMPSPIPVPTRLAVATRPAAIEQATATIPNHAAGETPRAANWLPALLAAGAGVAYVLFILFVVLLAVLFVVVKLRQR